MANNEQNEYYASRVPELLAGFDRDAQQWRPILAHRYGGEFAAAVLQAARERFQSLIFQIPYIGGDANHLTASLIGSVRCLALYQAMKTQDKSVEETGKVLYDAVMTSAAEPPPPIPPEQWLSRDELMEQRQTRAARSQLRRYAWDWVYEFVEGDGEAFDYGYDFSECATEKFYRAQDALDFLPFYCFLDFPKCQWGRLGLSRTKTLGEGHGICEFRFKEGGKAQQVWPPPFLKPEQ
jgi:hypothetical protein